MRDLISRQAAIDSVCENCEYFKNEKLIQTIKDLPSAQPEHLVKESGNLVKGLVNDCISRQAAQPEQIARDIATIIENEQDMRVVLKNAEHTETHSCDCEHTETHESRREWYMKGYRDAQAVSCTDLCVDCPLFDHEKHECPRFNRVIPRAIGEVKPSWIPVTPDSPPLYMPVLTWDGGTRHVEQRIPYIRDEYGEKIISDWWIDGDEKWDEWAEYQPNLRDGCAIKWMPLPEAYEGGRDD